ncbi:MAG: xanthine dehydrogenase family protein molybdopterin-binding subunit [Planctomycetaceae bacterium]|nr:xanthine dehydrogenase family protein molybdopterin-binding subunit [Planctomycetaceae bacterium]
MVDLKVEWKPRDENTVFNKPTERLDGIEKASGFAKYSTDFTGDGSLHARLLTSPHAHAKIKSIDVEPAKSVHGVRGVYVFPQRAPEGDTLYEINWEGEVIVAVAAETPAQAAQGVKAINIEYEVLEHFVDEADLEAAERMDRSIPGRRVSVDGDEDQLENLLKTDAPVHHQGRYGIHTITHCCLEPHGSTCSWNGDDKLDVELSTQNVSGTGGQFAGAPEIGIDAANVTVHCDYIGGGFGSKFAADEWGIACAILAKQTGKRVQLHLDRGTELKIAGTRPSAFADVTIAAYEDGTIAAWDSHHWGTNGIKGGTVSQVPYVFQPGHSRVRTTGLVTNTGPTRAWRAPNHPQACALTCTAIDDLAAKLEMDPLDLFMKNVGLATGSQSQNPVEVYTGEMEVAERLMDWKAKWKGRGQWDDNGWKRGLGMALHTWGGRAGGGSCTIKVHPDGTIETFAGTQDLGTGTRTCIAQVVAETFGVPLATVRVNIGSSKYPQSGASGGSTTIGGVSGPHRRAALDALGKIFDKVAAKYNVDATQLAAKDGMIVNGDAEVCSWQQAASLVGPMGLEVMGEGPKDDGLTADGAGGVQMVDLSVDPETGRVKINKYVAVQDIGTIVNHQLAKSQVLGAMIQCISYGLSEERIMDNASGRFINANLRDYKLPRLGDIGELVVEFYEPDSQYNKGVVGLGEPPVISGGAAISNAVANAIGVRVPTIPLTPKRILDALANA